MVEVSTLNAWDVGWAVLAAALGGFACRAFLMKKKGLGTHNPTNWPLLGMLPAMLVNLHHIHDWAISILVNNGGSFLFEGPWLSNMSYYLTADARNIEHVLRTHFASYPKDAGSSHAFHDLLGDGIFNADGALWKTQRKLLSLYLNSRPCRQFSDSTVFNAVADKLLPTLQHFCSTGLRFDLQDVLLRFNFDNVCMLGFGVEMGCLSADLPEVPFFNAFETALECTLARFVLPPAWWKALRWLRLGKERRMPGALRVVNEFTLAAISARNKELQSGATASADTGFDLLSSLLRTGGHALVNQQFLKDMGVNFVLAGRDTTALALSWFFWLLGENPRVEEKAVAEARRIIGSVGVRDGKPLKLTRTQLNQMHYLHAALTESLRLYPSIPMDIKHTASDDVLPDGTFLKKNTKLIYCIQAMGRMEGQWGSDCLSFRPERWLDPCNGTFTNAHVPACHYRPFNAGPRTCLGKDISFVQMKAVASTILLHFRVVLVPGQKIIPELSLTLYMKYGLFVNLEPRI